VGKKRPERTARRVAARAERDRVRDRERLFALERGGSAAKPIEVVSSSVIEVRALSLKCLQCDGAYQLVEHTAENAALRRVQVRCVTCGVARSLWFAITGPTLN
jgi:hypothetical protein